MEKLKNFWYENNLYLNWIGVLLALILGITVGIKYARATTRVNLVQDMDGKMNTVAAWVEVAGEERRMEFCNNRAHSPF